MADKYLPELELTTVLQDDDLVYVTGPASNDYRVSCKHVRSTFKPLVSSTGKALSYTVLASECDGRWFSNQGAVSSVEFTLPAAVDGLRVGFFVKIAKFVIVTPQLTQRIVYLTSMDGQSSRTNTLGSSLFLRATSHDWYVMHATGNWTAV